MKLKPENRPKRGRPRDPEKMRNVLSTAQQHFTAHGFDRTSIDDIAEESGVSKQTIYSYFPSKEALFRAAVSDRTDAIFNVIQAESLSNVDPKTALTRVGAAFLQLMRDDKIIGSHRTLYGSAVHQPEAANAFYAAGPQRVISDLAAYLRAAHKRGVLNVSKPELASDQFFSLFLGGSHIRTLLGLGKPTPTEDGELLRENVNMFLSRYGPKEP